MLSRFQEHADIDKSAQQLILEVCSSDTQEAERARGLVVEIKAIHDDEDQMRNLSPPRLMKFGEELKKVVRMYHSKYLIGHQRSDQRVSRHSVIQRLPGLLSKLPTEETVHAMPSAIIENSDETTNDTYKIGKKYFSKPRGVKAQHAAFPSIGKIQDPSLASYLKDAMQDYKLGCEINDQAPHYSINSFKQLPALHLEVKELRAHKLVAAQELQSQILDIAKSVPPDHWLYEEWFLGRSGGEIPTPDLEMCLRLFLRNNPEEFEKKFLISTASSKKLQNLIEKFLITSTEEQRLKRAEDNISEAMELIKKGVVQTKIDISLHKAGEALFQRRVYECYSYPEILVFEYKNEMMLHKQQVEAIEELIQSDQRIYPNKAIQRIMGAGKTVVLGTLLAMLKADGYHLSLLVPPRALFDTNAQDMKLRSQNIFGQKAETIIF